MIQKRKKKKTNEDQNVTKHNTKAIWKNTTKNNTKHDWNLNNRPIKMTKRAAHDLKKDHMTEKKSEKNAVIGTCTHIIVILTKVAE